MRHGKAPVHPIARVATDEYAGLRGDVETLRDGTRILVRPIHASDVELERRFIETLSPGSRRFRFLETMSSPSEALLEQLTTIDDATAAAYIALIVTGGKELEIGVARFSASARLDDCEFAVTVGDDWQQKGVGTLLMKRLIELARKRGIRALHSSDAADNDSMRKFAEHLHFRHVRDPDDARQVLYTVELGEPEATRPST